MQNIQIPNSKFQIHARVIAIGVWNLEFGIWRLPELFLLFLTISLLTAAAQVPPQPPQLDPLLHLMMNQPSIEFSTNVQASAAPGIPRCVIRTHNNTTYTGNSRR